MSNPGIARSISSGTTWTASRRRLDRLGAPALQHARTPRGTGGCARRTSRRSAIAAARGVLRVGVDRAAVRFGGLLVDDRCGCRCATACARGDRRPASSRRAASAAASARSGIRRRLDRVDVVVVRARVVRVPREHRLEGAHDLDRARLRLAVARPRGPTAAGPSCASAKSVATSRSFGNRRETSRIATAYALVEPLLAAGIASADGFE